MIEIGTRIEWSQVGREKMDLFESVQHLFQLENAESCIDLGSLSRTTAGLY